VPTLRIPSGRSGTSTSRGSPVESGVARRRWKILLGCGLTCAIAASCILLSPLYMDVDYFLIKVPRTKDPRLVGTWRGTWKFLDEKAARYRETTFRSDGTGSFSEEHRHNMPFDWGTEDGVLYTRRMATDAWSRRRIPYKLSKDAAEFKGVKMFDLVTAKMKRQATATPNAKEAPDRARDSSRRSFANRARSTESRRRLPSFRWSAFA
jgi:hypothetical protein